MVYTSKQRRVTLDTSGTLKEIFKIFVPDFRITVLIFKLTGKLCEFSIFIFVVVVVVVLGQLQCEQIWLKCNAKTLILERFGGFGELF